MAVTVSGTSITFNDATVQTTAAGVPTTAQVLSATAGATVGAVGTYAMLVTSQNTATGNTVAGSNCRYAPGIGSYEANAFYYTGGTPSGTWRVMGFINYRFICGNPYAGATVMLRIS